MKPLYILAAALTALPVLATAEVRLYGEIKSGVEASRIKSGGSSVSHSNCIFYPVGQKYQNSNQVVRIPFSVVPFSAK